MLNKHNERVKPSYTADFDIWHRSNGFFWKWADGGIPKNAYILSTSLFPPFFRSSHFSLPASFFTRLHWPTDTRAYLTLFSQFYLWGCTYRSPNVALYFCWVHFLQPSLTARLTAKNNQSINQSNDYLLRSIQHSIEASLKVKRYSNKSCKSCN